MPTFHHLPAPTPPFPTTWRGLHNWGANRQSSPFTISAQNAPTYPPFPLERSSQTAREVPHGIHGDGPPAPCLDGSMPMPSYPLERSRQPGRYREASTMSEWYWAAGRASPPSTRQHCLLIVYPPLSPASCYMLFLQGLTLVHFSALNLSRYVTETTPNSTHKTAQQVLRLRAEMWTSEGRPCRFSSPSPSCPPHTTWCGTSPGPPPARASHYSTFQLNLSTFCGGGWPYTSPLWHST